MFVDQVTITVEAGDGGDGCASFRREKFVPLGGPDGGDGGKGADIVLATDSRLTTLVDLRYQKICRGENGQPGRGSDRTGKSGKTRVIPLPVGTLVKDLDSGEILKDLDAEGMEFIVAKGGRGGHGNARFKSSTNRAPRTFQKGSPGETKNLLLELKLLADVAIVGFPNAGKSTLIAKISNARPKIADYPFTTLVPQLGLVRVGEYFSFVAADIPGLIEGAHTGKGLGIRFLKHIERSRLLVHLLDFSAQSPDDPLENYNKLQTELKRFSENLHAKPQILVASKVDHPEARAKFEALAPRFKEIDPGFRAISSVTGEGIDDLLFTIKEYLENHPQPKKPVENI